MITITDDENDVNKDMTYRSRMGNIPLAAPVASANTVKNCELSPMYQPAIRIEKNICMARLTILKNLETLEKYKSYHKKIVRSIEVITSLTTCQN